MTSVRILGLDPGTRMAGYGVIDLCLETRSLTLVECGEFRFSRADSIEVRLAALGLDLAEVLDEFQPVAAGLERAYLGKSVVSTMRLSEARGVALEVLLRRDIDVKQYASNTAKKCATGRGNASKGAVSDCIMRTFGLAVRPGPDATDALAIAVTRAAHYRP